MKVKIGVISTNYGTATLELPEECKTMKEEEIKDYIEKNWSDLNMTIENMGEIPYSEEPDFDTQFDIEK